MQSEPAQPRSRTNKELVTQIVTGVLGALLLGLQGVNISETGYNQELIRRLETALHQQTELINHVTNESSRIDAAIQNQQGMLAGLETIAKNQRDDLEIQHKIYELMRKAKEEP